jgi:hypothetical protein
LPRQRRASVARSAREALVAKSTKHIPAAEWEHTEVMLAAHNLLVYLDKSRT